MAIYDDGTRHQLKNNSSYSSLPAGLEIIVPPKYAMPPPEKTSQYTYKPLPPLPPLPALPTKSPNRYLGHKRGSNPFNITAKGQVLTLSAAKTGRDRRGSVKKIEKLLGRKTDVLTRQPKIEQLAGNSNHSTYPGPPQLPEMAGLSNLDLHNHVDSFSDIHQYMKSDSEYSLSSGSIYSQDNTVEEIVDIYSKWGSWAPSPETLTSPVKHPVYLQPNVYSASATELRSSSLRVDVRRPSRVSLDGAQSQQKEMTLANLITEERERMGGCSPRSEKRQFGHANVTTALYDQVRPIANTFRYPSWNENDIDGCSLTPQPLALKPKDFQEPHRSISRWSNHSSEGEGGMISNARDSVISHIRSIPSPFKTPSRPSMVFRRKAASSTIQVPSPAPVKRKRAFSSGKHPLKSPFPFRSPLHKKLNSEDSPNAQRSSFARRFSDSFKHFSGIRNSPIIDSRIISNHARTGDGPDTPMPTKPGLIGIIPPTSVLLQKGTLQIQDAMRKAKRAARVRSGDERRRDRLRKKIVVVSEMEQSPPVSRWL